MFLRLLDTLLPAAVLVALVLAMATSFGGLGHAPTTRLTQGTPAGVAAAPCATSAGTGAGSCG